MLGPSFSWVVVTLGRSPSVASLILLNALWQAMCRLPSLPPATSLWFTKDSVATRWDVVWSLKGSMLKSSDGYFGLEVDGCLFRTDDEAKLEGWDCRWCSLSFETLRPMPSSATLKFKLVIGFLTLLRANSFRSSMIGVRPRVLYWVEWTCCPN